MGDVGSTRWQRILALGLLIWLCILLMSFILLPVEAMDRQIYRAALLLLGVAITVGASTFYFPSTGADLRYEGVLVGLVWLMQKAVMDLVVYYIVAAIPVYEFLEIWTSAGFKTKQPTDALLINAYIPVIAITFSILMYINRLRKRPEPGPRFRGPTR
jgi:hypothetical protein